MPGALLLGALASQHLGGLHPCEMCFWQRWPHAVAIVLALVALVLRDPRLVRTLVLLAAAAAAVSGLIGLFHAGVEYRWWPGITGCSTVPGLTGSADDMLGQLMNQPIVRCDVAQWTLGGVSLAGFNAILSLGGAALVVFLALRKDRA